MGSGDESEVVGIGLDFVHCGKVVLKVVISHLQEMNKKRAKLNGVK